MKIIGITGGVGSGKSEVLKYLADHYNCAVVQADKAGHLLMEPGRSCYQPVIDLLGQEIIQQDGMLDRKKMAALVYADKKLLAGLNEIIHPAVKTYIQQKIDGGKDSGRQYFFIEAALLLEDRYDQICDEIWYVYAHPDVRRARLKSGRGYDDDKINGIMKNQLPDAEFFKRCDAVIDNSSSFENTIIEIDLRMRKL